MSGYTSIIDATPAFVAGTFDAKDVRLAAIGNALPGLFASGHLAVTQRAAGANMSVDVGAGQCFVDPGAVAYQGPYVVRNDASFNTLSDGGYAWTAADATNPRIDLLCIEVADTDFSGSYTGWKLRIVDGTPNAGATHQLEAAYWPAVPTGCVPIAAIRIPASDTTIGTAEITNLNPIGGVGRSAARYTTTAETTTSATSARLATPDALLVYVPSTSAVVRLYAELHWKISVASGTQNANLFIDGAALKYRNGTNGAPAAGAGKSITSLSTFYGRLSTVSDLTSTLFSGTAGATADVTDITTGVCGAPAAGGALGPITISQLSAGWHLFELRFSTSANTLSVRERRMSAEVIG